MSAHRQGTCLLTGKEQHNANAWGKARDLNGEHRTLPATFSSAGYETCLVGKMHFNRTHQFNGFDHRPYGDLTGHGIQQPGHEPDPIRPENLTTQARRQGIDIGTRIPGASVTEIPESLLQGRWSRANGSPGSANIAPGVTTRGS